MLNVSFIGAGWTGQVQIQAVRELGRKIAIHSLVDIDKEFLAQQAQELDVGRTALDYHDVLDDDTVDAISICLPHKLHKEVAIEAAKAGKHVLCTKPIALSVQDATEMMAAAMQHEVVLYVAEHEAYTSITNHLRSLVNARSSGIGELLFAVVTQGVHMPKWGYHGRRAWLADPNRGGTGTWALHGVHTVAQIRHILGEVAVVYMREHHGRSFDGGGLEGTVSALLTLETGVQVSLVQTAEHPLPQSMFGFKIFGDQGSICASRSACEVFRNSDGKEATPERRDLPEQALSPYALMLESFADNVSGEASGPTTASSERRSLAVVQAGYESIETGRPVDLKERFGDI